MKTIRILLIAVIATAFIHGSAFSQTKKTINKTVTSKAYEATRGQDPNIKSDEPTEDKRETKSRGADDCTIYFDNYSGLYVKVYVDGDYMGTMSPYGSLTVYAGGYTTIYCVSVGNTRYWSDSGDCSGYYHYKLDY